jgi:hypothetical protein
MKDIEEVKKIAREAKVIAIQAKIDAMEAKKDARLARFFASEARLLSKGGAQTPKKAPRPSPGEKKAPRAPPGRTRHAKRHSVRDFRVPKSRRKDIIARILFTEKEDEFHGPIFQRNSFRTQ